MMIGIRQGNYLVYQGLSGHGHALLPTPVLSMAAVLSSADELSQMRLGRGPSDADLLFREDSFDAVTRIRRGRLYRATPSRPERWKVSTNHELPDQGRPDVYVFAFDSDLVGDIGREADKKLIALGVTEAYTLWRIVHAERIVTGETLLTLRARSSLGILPELNEAAIPIDGKEKVIETLGKLTEAAYRAGPESIIDRARDVAQWSIGSWLAHREDDPKLRLIDLWELAGKVQEIDFAVVRNTGRSLARLHARNKPNVQEEKGTRAVTEDDAEYALAAVGLLLREMKWAA
jgi:hypothetical protein